MTALYNKHRPRRLEDLRGQPEVVAVLRSKLDAGTLPHVLMFTGPAGTGKTTTAMILRRELGCGRADFTKVNATESRGIDTVREIRQRIGLAPLAGKCRIWFVEECHGLTKEAQSAFLEMLEFTPRHARFFLGTTDPHKLLKTIHSRCMEVKLQPLSDKAMRGLLNDVLRKEGTEASAEMVDRIVEMAEGSARKALVLLDGVIALPDGERLEALQRSDARRQAFDLAKALLWDRGVRWADVRAILEAVKDEDPEGVRRLVLSCAAGAVVKGGPAAARAVAVLEAFEMDFFQSGYAGLVRACVAVAGRK